MNWNKFDTLIKCTICKNLYCTDHILYNPFYDSKCSCCVKYWNICSWCKYEKLYFFLIESINKPINKPINKIQYEQELCNIFH